MNCDYCKKWSENTGIHLLPALLIKFANTHLQSNFTDKNKLCNVCIKRINNIFHSRINKAMTKKRLLLQREMATLTVREASNKQILDAVYKHKLLQRKKSTNVNSQMSSQNSNASNISQRIMSSQNSNASNISLRIMSSQNTNTSNDSDENENIPAVVKTIIPNNTGG